MRARAHQQFPSLPYLSLLVSCFGTLCRTPHTFRLSFAANIDVPIFAAFFTHGSCLGFYWPHLASVCLLVFFAFTFICRHRYLRWFTYHQAPVASDENSKQTCCLCLCIFTCLTASSHGCGPSFTFCSLSPHLKQVYSSLPVLCLLQHINSSFPASAFPIPLPILRFGAGTATAALPAAAGRCAVYSIHRAHALPRTACARSDATRAAAMRSRCPRVWFTTRIESLLYAPHSRVAPGTKRGSPSASCRTYLLPATGYGICERF